MGTASSEWGDLSFAQEVNSYGELLDSQVTLVDKCIHFCFICQLSGNHGRFSVLWPLPCVTWCWVSNGLPRSEGLSVAPFAQVL